MRSKFIEEGDVIEEGDAKQFDTVGAITTATSTSLIAHLSNDILLARLLGLTCRRVYGCNTDGIWRPWQSNLVIFKMDLVNQREIR